jgi:ABC-2 type transport system ATP-binding protein
MNRMPAPVKAAGNGTAAAVPAAVTGPPADALPLALRSVSKRWAKDQAPVLDDVDLDLDIGTSTWIGGRNGVGKTTLLRIAAGLIDPDRGRVQAWGFTAAERRGRYQQLISLLPAGDRGLYARLTVRRQLQFWARIAMVDRGRAPAAVEEAIDAFALRELAGRRVDRMSMGQRQRVRIAMTFLAEPEVVLLDEPLTSLDSEGAEILERAIDGLIGRGGALLWCSPEGERVDREFDTRLVLERGRLISA